MSRRIAINWSVGAAATGLAAALAWWSFHDAVYRNHWREAGRAQDADVARVHLAQCLAWRGDRPEVGLRAAQAARLAGDYEAAEEHLANCENQHGLTEADVKRERALFQVQQGDISGSLEYLKADSNGGEPSPQVLEAMARGLEATFNEAGPYLQRLIAREPENPRAHLLAGNIMLRKRYAEQALQEFQAAVRQLPDAFMPRLRLAECLVDLGEVREAQTHLQALQERYPDAHELMLAQARVAVYRAQPQQAKEILRRLLAVCPNHVEALVTLGQLEFRQGEPQDALPWLHRATRIHPDKPEAWETLARCHAALEEPDEEKRCLAEFDRVSRALGEVTRRIVRVTQGQVKDPDPRIDVAERYERLHEPTKAIQWRFCVLQVDPAHAPTHRALARLFEQTCQRHRAARHRALAEKM